MSMRWVGVSILILLSGCGDPIARAVNDRFPPVNVEEQRKLAIDTSVAALAGLPSPNIAASVALDRLPDTWMSCFSLFSASAVMPSFFSVSAEGKAHISLAEAPKTTSVR